MNPFKKFCISFVVLSVLLLLILQPVLFYANLGIADAPARTIDNWFKIKEGHARESSGRKLFVLSCSTALYGADTALMEQKLEMPVINFGTTVSLRKYMLDRIKASMSSGDIILMPLEYHAYRDRPFEEEVFVYILEYDPEYFRRLPLADKINAVYALKASFLTRRIIARVFSNEYGDEGDSFLLSRYLNRNGDLTSNTYETRFYRKPDIPAKQNFSDEKVPGKKMKQVLAGFAEYCRDSNISLYVTWPPIYPITGQKEFYGHDAETVESIKEFWASVSVDVLGDYRDALFEADDCYNSQNHLNDRARPVYTKHLIELIRPYL